MKNLFYFPQGQINKPAKLYKRYTYKQPITIEEANTLSLELNNYTNHDTFRWVFETEIQTGQTSQMSGMIDTVTYVTIKTNTQCYINPGDIVWLICPAFPQGKYFVITGQVKQDYIYTPTMRPSFKHLELRSLM